MESHTRHWCSYDYCGSPQEPSDQMHHVFRQSWLNTALNVCPEQARLTHVKHLPPDATDAAAVGTAVHAAIELNLGSTASYDECMERAEEAWWEEQNQDGFKWVKYSGRTGWNLIEQLFTNWWYQFKPNVRNTMGWEVEQSFRVPLVENDKRIIDLTGTIDAFDGFRIYDWKTSGSDDKYDGAKQRELQRWAIQPTVYTYAHNVLYGTNPAFEYGALVPSGLVTFTAYRDERDWAWLGTQCTSLALLIEQDMEQWPLNDQHWLCSAKWCPAYSLCKGRYYGQL